jgi:hypothetical protein
MRSLSLSPLLLAIPASNVTVTVKVLNSFPTLDRSSDVTFPPASGFYFPVINSGAELVGNIYAFYVEHPTTHGEVERFMFDIGIRKDIENLAPIWHGLFNGTAPTDVPTQLVAGGVELDTVKAVFWR